MRQRLQKEKPDVTSLKNIPRDKVTDRPTSCLLRKNHNSIAKTDFPGKNFSHISCFLKNMGSQRENMQTTFQSWRLLPAH